MCAAATGHRPANYPDSSRLFFFFNRGMCNFLTILIFPGTEEIQLSTNCGRLAASKKTIMAIAFPQLTKLPQLTTGQVSPDSGQCSHLPLPALKDTDDAGSRQQLSSVPSPMQLSCPMLQQQQDLLLCCQSQSNNQVK